MADQTPITLEENSDPGLAASEDDLWFLPGPVQEEADFLPPGPRAEPPETSVLADWIEAEAMNAARLARVAGRLGALDDRLLRGPEGWRHRLALIEAADLSWFAGDRIGADRLALWLSLRLSGAQEDSRALIRIGWAVRRLTQGPGPMADLAAFLDRRDPENGEGDTERFEDRATGWLDVMKTAMALHPITQGCLGFHLWNRAGLDQHGDPMEAAVSAARLVAGECRGAVFAPMGMGGAMGWRAARSPSERLLHWLDGLDNAILKAMRHLDAVETWEVRARAAMSGLSGRTPGALGAVLREWPLVSAPMAEALTGASRAAVQRNLSWMERQGLITEVTGQGRFRFWRAAV